MNFNVNRVKIIVTIPIENLEEVRNAICEAGAILFLFAIIKALWYNREQFEGADRDGTFI